MTKFEKESALVNALSVLVLTPHIRAYLEGRDPKALKQALSALKEIGVDMEGVEITEGQYELGRPINLFVCADGTVTFGPRGWPPFNRIALPVHSVNTLDEAVMIQRTLCRLQHVEHPKMPGKPWFVLSNYSGDIEDLPSVAATMQQVSARLAGAGQ